MKLDLRTKSLAVVGEGLVGDQDARKAVESWYEVSATRSSLGERDGLPGNAKELSKD